MELGHDDAYGRGPHDADLRDVHRRYAEVTTSEDVLGYLAELTVRA